ncbi:hypothetical protein [Streptomyces sp. NPDC093970]|uniref:hypothetical protein n=1 Tax=Streptomyces sp. NPDC093970 TaxID=3155076 RepID=UPI00341DDD68
MGDYAAHAHRAQELIAGLKVDEQLNRRVRGLLNEHIIAIAQVEAILALAAAMNAGNEAADTA